jgi:hypothetical protein
MRRRVNIGCPPAKVVACRADVRKAPPAVQLHQLIGGLIVAPLGKTDV